MFDQRPGEESLELATTLNNLGVALSRQKRIREADFVFRRALAITEKYVGANHVQNAATTISIRVHPSSARARLMTRSSNRCRSGW